MVQTREVAGWYLFCNIQQKRPAEGVPRWYLNCFAGTSPRQSQAQSLSIVQLRIRFEQHDASSTLKSTYTPKKENRHTVCEQIRSQSTAQVTGPHLHPFQTFVVLCPMICEHWGHRIPNIQPQDLQHMSQFCSRHLCHKQVPAQGGQESTT